MEQIVLRPSPSFLNTTSAVDPLNTLFFDPLTALRKHKGGGILFPEFLAKYQLSHFPHALILNHD